MHRRPRTAVGGCSEFPDLERLRPYRLRSIHRKSDPNTHCSLRQKSALLMRFGLYSFQNHESPSYLSEPSLSTQIIRVLERLVLISDPYCSHEWATSTVLEGLSCPSLPSWIHTQAASSGRFRWGELLNRDLRILIHRKHIAYSHVGTRVGPVK